MALTHDEQMQRSTGYREAWHQGRIKELEAALREIAGTYDETEQTPTKLCAALYAVSKLAARTLKST